MQLRDFENYEQITIQCHDNPDADAIASGFGLYCYFRGKGIKTKLVYSGRNAISKSNLTMMLEKLQIPITYISYQGDDPLHVSGLLITVDCQYGAGNVTGIVADDVAIIDHHQVEIGDVEKSLIVPSLGSCSTLVWKLLKEAGYPFEKNKILSTALFYGLYCDTNQLSEIRSPLDKDMRDELIYDNSMITLLKNSNLSLHELEVAGIAMIRYSYNPDYEFAVIKVQPCDPNLLGLISDFLLQVDVIKTCVVFNETTDGYKLSVRSCVREVNASEMVAYLTEKIGSGGGHYEKAGGYISNKLFQKSYARQHAEAYFNTRMIQYFESFDIVNSEEYVADISKMESYVKKKLPIGYVKMDEVLPLDTPITIRTLEGDIDIKVEKDLYIMIGIKGEVYPNKQYKFLSSYQPTEEKYRLEQCVVSADYIPTIKNRADGQTLLLTDLAKVCIPKGTVAFYAKELKRNIKIFTAWDKEKYMLGRPGDYLAVKANDLHDMYVIERDIFEKSYEKTV